MASEPAAASAPTAQRPDVDIDSQEHDVDSAYDSEIASYTTSLASGVTDYKHEHGRRYHAYRDGEYPFPNDEKEMDRLDMTHKMVETAMHGKLHTAPLRDPERILDIGTGTGIWAMEMGDAFPQCQVLGNDLSPIQPRWVPPNVRFEVDDAEAEWTYAQPFDFIHCRCMYGALKDWPALVRRCFEHVKPGAYVEMVDFDLLLRSPDGSVPGTAMEKVNLTFIETSTQGGKEPNPGRYLKKWMEEAGFVDVHETVTVMPSGTWPADKRLKEIGAWNYLQMVEGLDSFFMAMFTRVLGWRKEEVDVICAQGRKDLKDPKFHGYFTCHDVYGKKPESKTARKSETAGATATAGASATAAAPATTGASATGGEASGTAGKSNGADSAA